MGARQVKPKVVLFRFRYKTPARNAALDLYKPFAIDYTGLS